MGDSDSSFVDSHLDLFFGYYETFDLWAIFVPQQRLSVRVASFTNRNNPSTILGTLVHIQKQAPRLPKRKLKFMTVVSQVVELSSLYLYCIFVLDD